MALTAVMIDGKTPLRGADLNKYIQTVGHALTRGISRAQFDSSGNTVSPSDNITFSTDNGTGSWTFSFTTTYSNTPVVVVTPVSASARKGTVNSVSTSGFTLLGWDDGTTATDEDFAILAIGD